MYEAFYFLSGLSGGWRGFAIDQRLCVGDVVVFFLPDQPSATLRLNSAIHIHAILFRKRDGKSQREALAFARGAPAAAGHPELLRALPPPSPFTPPAVHTYSEGSKAAPGPSARARGQARERAAARFDECEAHAGALPRI